MKYDTVLKTGNVFFEGRFVDADIGIERGKIVKVSKGELAGEKEIRLNGKIVLPGIIDSHVHFRTPGGEHKEDWKTGSKAAVAGGVTTVLDMPNNNPATITNYLLEQKRETAKRDSLANFGFYLGATSNNETEVRSASNIAGVKVFMGSSTGNLLMDSKEDLEKEFSLLSSIGKLGVLHAEDEQTIKKNSEKFKGENDPEIHAKVRGKECAVSAVETALEMQGRLGNRAHFLHVSTKEELELIRKAKQEGRDVSCEACPHHLFLTEKEFKEKGNLVKTNPPLRSKDDKMALWNAIEFGLIDTIGSDHAPHLKQEKEMDYWNAPSGIPGVETMLPLLLNAVNENKLSLQRLVRLCCRNPAKIFGIREKGKIEEGFDADLVVIDLKKEHTIRDEKVFSKCGWSPFNGKRVKGSVEKTFVRGKMVFSEGEILEENSNAKEVNFYE
jgi:dihydroorotase